MGEKDLRTCFYLVKGKQKDKSGKNLFLFKKTIFSFNNV